MKRLQIIVLIVLVLCVIGQSSWAAKAYVTDSFEITLRTGPSVQNKILTLIGSGEAVEVLESQEEWTHVRVLGGREDAIEGWVLSRYLETRLPWKTQAESLKKENARLKEKLAQGENKWSKSMDVEQKLSKELGDKINALNRLKEKYESLKRGSAEYIKVKAAYDVTLSSLETAQRDVQGLTKENESLKSSQRNRWFAMGALVLLCGLMIGVVVGRQQRKRKSIYH
jgi:SH3 domain protein